MINPNNINIVEYKETPEVKYIKIDNPPAFDIESYDLLDDKDFKQYINDVKTQVRQSFEYRNLISFLKENGNLNECAFYDKINCVENRGIAIHLHHHPFTLEDIVRTVFNKRCQLRESVTLQDVAKEVMFLHYDKKVGLIPLSETVHELVHSQYVFIPMNFAFGDFMALKILYDPYMIQDLIETFEEIQKVSYASI